MPRKGVDEGNGSVAVFLKRGCPDDARSPPESPPLLPVSMGGKRMTDEEAERRCELRKRNAEDADLNRKRVKIANVMKRSEYFTSKLYEEACRLERAAADRGSAAGAADDVEKETNVLTRTCAGTVDERKSAFEMNRKRAIDRRHATLIALPVCDLKFVLFFLDPKLFNPHSLKALKDNETQRDCTKESLCSVIEYLTQLPPDFTLDTTCFRTVGDLCDHAAAMRDGLGDRASRMGWRPNWGESDGVYLKVACSQDELTVKQNMSEEAVTIPNGYHGLKWDTPEDVRIEFPWSDLRGRLRASGCKAHVQCQGLFGAKVDESEPEVTTGAGVEKKEPPAKGKSSASAAKEPPMSKLMGAPVKPDKKQRLLNFAGSASCSSYQKPLLDKKRGEKSMDKIDNKPRGRSMAGGQPPAAVLKNETDLVDWDAVRGSLK